jgi:hypothetical protein
VTYGMVRRQRRKIGVVKPRGRRKKNVSVTWYFDFGIDTGFLKKLVT